MKLVLSRKGFDASAGGGPSPILPDGRLAPLPIPDPDSPVRYRDLRVAGEPCGPLVRDLSRGRIHPEQGAHLDPDLDAAACPRPPGWRPLFGQSGSAQGHLAARGVGPGDVFLFFGWFRETVRQGGRLRFRPGAPDLHVLFGWLRVTRAVSLASLPRDALPWARRHPHFHGERGRANTLYLGTRSGAGLFPRFHPELCLSAPGPRIRRSVWQLPAWFHPARRGSSLSHHEVPARWSLEGGAVQLRSSPRGQEFVLDGAHYPEVRPWLDHLMRLAKRPTRSRAG